MEWVWNEMLIHRALNNFFLEPKTLEKLLPEHRDNLKILRELGAIKVRLSGENKQGIELLKEAVKIDPQDISSCFYLAKAYNLINDVNSEIQEYYRCATLAETSNSITSRLRSDIIKQLYNAIFLEEVGYGRYPEKQSIFSEKYKIPISEQIEIIEHLNNITKAPIITTYYFKFKIRMLIALIALNLIQNNVQLASDFTKDLITLIKNPGQPYSTYPDSDYFFHNYESPELSYLLKTIPNSAVVKQISEILTYKE